MRQSPQPNTREGQRIVLRSISLSRFNFCMETAPFPILLPLETQARLPALQDRIHQTGMGVGGRRGCSLYSEMLCHGRRERNKRSWPWSETQLHSAFSCCSSLTPDADSSSHETPAPAWPPYYLLFVTILSWCSFLRTPHGCSSHSMPSWPSVFLHSHRVK